MIVYWSIFAYTSVVSLFGMQISEKNKFKNQKNANDSNNISLFFAILSFLLLIFFVGCRSEFNDTYYYRDVYEYYITGNFSQIKSILESNSKSKCFLLLQCLFKLLISKKYVVWFFALAIFQMGAIIKLYYKYSVDYFLTAYLFIASGSFTWLMSGIRQFLAVAIVLYGFDYILERKTKKFIFLVIIASLFHISAIIWLPVYFICTIKPWSSKMIMLTLGAVILILLLDKFTNVFEDVLADTNYSGITESFGNGNGVSAIRVIVTCVPWVLALVCKRQIESENNKFLNVCVNLSFISSAIYFIGMFTSGIIVGRIPMYFMLVNYLIIPWIINKYFSRSSCLMLKLTCCFMYFLYFYYDMVIKGTGRYGSELLNIPYV